VHTRYPYEVLYDNEGICEEKSVLLAYILRGLGYSVVLFDFPQQHMAVGVKSPIQYSYINSGYAFIESAGTVIPTDSQSDYVGIGQLTSTPQIIQVSDGSSFATIAEEYKDAKTFNELQLLSKSSGGILDENYYNMWMLLVQKYGLKTSNY
jgi:hypothetical protein